MIIFPAIDIIGGQCVRLTYGDYATKKVYNEDPVKIAAEFEAAGFTHLHMVDLDGAKSGKVINHDILAQVTASTNLKIDFGGGLRLSQDVEKVLDAGALQINVGSLAVHNPEIVSNWIDQYGPEKIILSADVKDGYIAVHGWQEQSDLELIPFIQDYVDKGIRYITCTDIAKDGALTGASVDLYAELNQCFPEVHIIASGGVDSLDNLQKIQEAGCYGAIVGKAIYENKITLSELIKLNSYVG